MSCCDMLWLEDARTVFWGLCMSWFHVLYCCVLCCVMLCCPQTGVLGGLQLWDERVGPSPISKSSTSWGHTGYGLMDTQMGLHRQVRTRMFRNSVCKVVTAAQHSSAGLALGSQCTWPCSTCVLL